jgi:hypothetical protein
VTVCLHGCSRRVSLSVNGHGGDEAQAAASQERPKGEGHLKGEVHTAKVVNGFYDKVLQHPQLQLCFEGADMSKIKVRI